MSDLSEIEKETQKAIKHSRKVLKEHRAWKKAKETKRRKGVAKAMAMDFRHPPKKGE